MVAYYFICMVSHYHPPKISTVLAHYFTCMVSQYHLPQNSDSAGPLFYLYGFSIPSSSELRQWCSTILLLQFIKTISLRIWTVISHQSACIVSQNHISKVRWWLPTIFIRIVHGHHLDNCCSTSEWTTAPVVVGHPNCLLTYNVYLSPFPDTVGLVWAMIQE